MSLLAQLKAVKQSVIRPHAAGTVQAFRRIGYDIQVALADLIDNSVDAHASNVLIRFLRTRSSIERILIVDDGRGMSGRKLQEAMQFGGQIRHNQKDLGKFGIGLKAASFSQCRSVSVVSRQGASIAGMRWTIDTIDKGWKCDHLDPTEIDALMSSPWYGVNPDAHGTLILWEELDHLPADQVEVAKRLNKLTKEVSQHLGLVFHRFLAQRKIRIFVDTYNVESGLAGPPTEVNPLDPFGYQRTGHKAYPVRFFMKLDNLPRFVLEAHIWPPKSKDPGFTLGGGRVASRQGFYFYRNDRLIQSGGWNGWRANDSEPHLSLARLSIDLGPEFDSEFQLNVQKTSLNLPPGFFTQLEKVAVQSRTISSFVTDANEVYRRGRSEDSPDLTFVPGPGFPSSFRRLAGKMLKQRGVPIARVSLRRRKLPKGRVFQVDRETPALILNSRYIGSGRGGDSDLSAFKALIFWHLHDEFGRQRVTSVRSKEIARLNELLVAAFET